MAERKPKISTPRKQESVQINDATRREFEFLQGRGYGSLTEVVRVAIHTAFLVELDIIKKEMQQS